MDRTRALRIMQALFLEEPVGVAGDEEISKKLNQAFLAACMVAQPDLPDGHTLRAWNIKPAGDAGQPDGYAFAARERWALFFRDLADGLIARAVPAAEGGAT